MQMSHDCIVSVSPSDTEFAWLLSKYEGVDDDIRILGFFSIFEFETWRLAALVYRATVIQ
jgi:hypothetical protein